MLSVLKVQIEDLNSVVIQHGLCFFLLYNKKYARDDDDDDDDDDKETWRSVYFA